MIGPYGIENAILDRLSEELGPLARVASGAAISAQHLDVGELVEFGPLVVVEPRDTGVSSSTARADHIVEDQTWIVALVIKHVADPETLRSDYSELDPLLLAAIQSLTGWQPPTGMRELRYAGREDVVHDEAGLLEVGLTFTTFYHLTAAAKTA